MWEKKIFHPELRTFRVIRGNDSATVELRAKLQMEAWNERWRKIESALRKRQKEEAAAQLSSQRKALAQQRTREAESQAEALTRILRDGLEVDHALEWELLKQNVEFSEPEPQPPVPIQPPLPPDPNSSKFVPVLNFLDRLIRSRRLQKTAQSHAMYVQAKAEWDSTKNGIEESNRTQRTDYEMRIGQWEKRRQDHYDKQEQRSIEVDSLRTAYFAKEIEALNEYWSQVLLASEYPESFPRSFALDYIPETQMLVVEYELPDLVCLPRLKELKYIAVRDELREIKVSDTWLNKTYDEVLYQICLRTIHEIFQSDSANAVSSIVFNGWVNYVDKSNGQEVNACVLSLEAAKQEFSQLNLAQVDPKTCFRSLKGVSGSKLVNRSAIRPILQLNKEDKRFVPSHDVAESLDDSFNLAAMDWLDFENLIREIFEKEFRTNGGEVKITQASRDGGVDAIAFDPDPIRGGKIVIQAKRYTNTVGVSAVRDLFGTVHNEGATKGILVTTSVYGPDAYEFAKGKPLTLLNGSELLYLLQKHGHRARIDLAEARRLAAEQASGG